MPVIDYNFTWMIYNSFLALIPLALGFLIFYVNNKLLKIIIGFFWFIFLPNTIYIFTDLEHFIKQWHEVRQSVLPLLILQYAVFEAIGILTFVFACFPFEKIIKAKKLLKKHAVIALIVFNFLIAFGMVLGRVERINSWDIFTNPSAVAISAYHVLFSFDLLGLTILFGLLCNFIYFLLRKRVLAIIMRLLH